MPVLREANHEGVGVDGLSDWHKDALRYKYDPIPEDGPRHRKKAKKRRVRSDHKHEYEKVCIDDHSYVYTRDGRLRKYTIATRCKVCGRLQDVLLGSRGCYEPPEGMPLYEVRDFLELMEMRELPEEKRVR